MAKTLRERFDEKVDRSGGPNACWPWTGAKTGRGYGHIYVKNVMVAAHRLSLTWKLGRPIRPGYLACHIVECHNRACVNPAHLYEGTTQENMDDKTANGTNVSVVVSGTRNGRCRYTEAQVEEVRRLRLVEHLSQTAIANRIGMSQQHVCDILNGECRRAA